MNPGAQTHVFLGIIWGLRLRWLPSESMTCFCVVSQGCFLNGFVVFPSLTPRQLTLQSLGRGFASGLPLSWEYCPLRPSLTWRGFFSLLWAGPRLFHLPQEAPNLNLHLSRWPNILTADASMRGFQGSSLALGQLDTCTQKGGAGLPPSHNTQKPKKDPDVRATALGLNKTLRSS